MPTSEQQLELLDDDTITAAYFKKLEGLGFQVWIECDIEDENPRKMFHPLSDPVGAIQVAEQYRDQLHKTWVEIVPLNDETKARLEEVRRINHEASVRFDRQQADAAS